MSGKDDILLPFTTAGMVFFSTHYQCIDLTIAGQYLMFNEIVDFTLLIFFYVNFKL